MRLLVFIALGVSLAATAAQSRQIEPFPSSQLVEEKRSAPGHYRLVLSELKRTGAKTYGEQERRLSGQLWRRYWAVDDSFSLDEVGQFFDRQFKQMNLLYQCVGLDCGSSHFWANQVFDNGRLVGREANQRYWVGVRPAADGQTEVWVAYVVQRGSRQVYVALDRLMTAETVSRQVVSEQSIGAALRQHYGWLPGLVVNEGSLDQAQSQALLNVLKSLPGRDKRRLYLMVHCYDASHMADNLRCSERLAQQLRVATFDGENELNILGQGALTAAPDDGVAPALRYVFWPQR